MLSESTLCRVCGYDNGEPPWGADGKNPTFDICPCCGVEWGYEDNNPDSTRKYRQTWRDRGAPWSDRHEPHDDLTVEQRLAKVPELFREA